MLISRAANFVKWQSDIMSRICGMDIYRRILLN